jgi:hypothetical protein
MIGRKFLPGRDPDLARVSGAIDGASVCCSNHHVVRERSETVEFVS